MRFFIHIFPMLFLPFLSTAQERCGADLQVNTSMATPPGSLAGELPEEIVIPVVVHVLWRTDVENITESQIHAQIASLNADFSRRNADFVQVPTVFAGLAANTGIRFELARTDPQGRPATGILRKRTSALLWINNDRMKQSATGGSDPWDSRYYLNIWVANLSSSLLGFSTFPGAPAEKDGIVIRYNVFGSAGNLSAPFDRGRTLTHEAGHWLGLQHLWGDTPCGDDGVGDTPRQRSGNRGVPQFPRVNTGCDNGPHGDMFMNFMDFSDDRALLMFTRGQADRMRNQFQAGGARQNILSSRGAGEAWNLLPAASPVRAEGLRVFPNPAHDYLQVRVSDTGHQFYVLTNLSGRVAGKGSFAGSLHRIDVSDLPPGIYFLRIGDDVSRWVKD